MSGLFDGPQDAPLYDFAEVMLSEEEEEERAFDFDLNLLVVEAEVEVEVVVEVEVDLERNFFIGGLEGGLDLFLTTAWMCVLLKLLSLLLSLWFSPSS